LEIVVKVNRVSMMFTLVSYWLELPPVPDMLLSSVHNETLIHFSWCRCLLQVHYLMRTWTKYTSWIIYSHRDPLLHMHTNLVQTTSHISIIKVCTHTSQHIQAQHHIPPSPTPSHHTHSITMYTHTHNITHSSHTCHHSRHTHTHSIIHICHHTHLSHTHHHHRTRH